MKKKKTLLRWANMLWKWTDVYLLSLTAVYLAGPWNLLEDVLTHRMLGGGKTELMTLVSWASILCWFLIHLYYNYKVINLLYILIQKRRRRFLGLIGQFSSCILFCHWVHCYGCNCKHYQQSDQTCYTRCTSHWNNGPRTFSSSPLTSPLTPVLLGLVFSTCVCLKHIIILC